LGQTLNRFLYNSVVLCSIIYLWTIYHVIIKFYKLLFSIHMIMA